MNHLQIITSFKRELWEYKRSLVAAPLIIAAILISVLVFEMVSLNDDQVFQINKVINASQQAEAGNAVERFSFMLTASVFGVFLFIAGFVQLKYFLSCLYDERRDKSIYFWRSLPVSDLQNVLVKFFTGALLVPLAFIISALIFVLVSFVLFIVIAAALGLGSEGSLWQFILEVDLFTPLWSTLLSLIPFMIWLFPLFAWLMLASMIAEKGPFLWATLPVILLLLGEVILVKGFNSGSFYFAYALRDYFAFSPTDPELAQLAVHFGVSSSPYFFSQALMTKIGLVPTLLGIAFMAATYWLRVKRSHV